MTTEPSKAQFRFACFHCRKMVRKPMPRSCFPAIMHSSQGLTCAECGTTLIFVGRYFEPPRRNDLKAWKRSELPHLQPGGYHDAIGKYRAMTPQQIDRQRQQEIMQKQTSYAGARKHQQCQQKRQKRLASRSKPGRSLTNV